MRSSNKYWYFKYRQLKLLINAHMFIITRASERIREVAFLIYILRPGVSYTTIGLHIVDTRASPDIFIGR